MFPVFEIFGKQIGTYGIMGMLGIVACLLVGSRLIKQISVDIHDFALIMIAVFIGMAVGASCLYGITHTNLLIYAFSHLSELGWKGLLDCLIYAFGGFVYYGGFIGSACALLIYTKFNKPLRSKRDDLFDIFAILVPLFHAFGRVGCFLGGCCYGIESPFGFTVHNNPLNPAINGVNRFPVQLLESGCNLLIFLLLLVLFKKHILEKRLIYLYLLIYPIVRFSDEFLRGDGIRGSLFGLSTSQWVSIILFVFALVMLPIKTKKLKAQSAQAAESDAD